MTGNLSKQVIIQLKEELHQSGVRDRSGSVVGPKSYVPLSLPKDVHRTLGEEAIVAGYEPGEKIKYKITIERVG